MIIKSEAYLVEMPLTEPYTIAYEVVSKAENVFFRIENASGKVGWGCAAPDLMVTGETAASVLEVFKDTIQPFLQDKDPMRPAFILEELKKLLPASKSSLAMVDQALFDLMGKKAGLPVYQMLGGFRDHIKTSITIGILPLEETLERARAYLGKGFSSIKLKGGAVLEEDIEKIMKLRELGGPELEIRFDANQGYTPKQAIEFVSATRQAVIEVFEQPTDRDNLDHLGLVSNNVHIPVMADESLNGLRDAFNLARNDQADMVNIKLMKVGGIWEAVQINSVARSARLEAMVGCMDESALGISAGLHFALARPNVTYADLDGHLDLLNDPAHGTVILKNGILYPQDAPGFGWNGH